MRSSHKPNNRGFDANSSEQWAQIVARFEKPLLSFFFKRTGNSDDAEDLAQEVFTRLLAKEKSAPILEIDSYLFQITANVLNDYFRRRKVRHSDHHFFSEDDSVFGSDFSSERVLLGKDEVKHVLDAIKRLPRRTQDIFVLRTFEGKRSVEVAQMMNLSVRSIEKHMAKALTHLNRSIRKKGN